MHFSNRKARRTILVTGVTLALGLTTLVAIRLVTGRSLGLKSWGMQQAQSVTSLARSVSNSQHVRSYNHGEFTNIVFLHHSVGGNLIEQSDLRERLTKAGYTFWDHDYNGYGLRKPDGSPAGYSYNVPNDNTDPDGLAAIFAQPVDKLPLNTFSGLLQHEVILFKSCFPVSDITSEAKLQEYKAHYFNMRTVIDKYPDKLFIVVTPPPLNPAETKPEIAVRARAFANWLKSDEFLKGHLNIFTFDLFDQLAGDDPTQSDYNMLRKAYQDGTDSHPNRQANETIGPLVADFVIRTAQAYRAEYRFSSH